MKKKLIIFSFFIVFIIGCSFFRTKCDQTSIRLLATAYSLSLDFYNPERFEVFVQDHPTEFGKKGCATICAMDLSGKLLEYGNGRYSKDKKLGESINALEMEYGLNPSYTSNKGSDLMALAAEIHWLGRVLPSAVEGDFELYYETGTPARIYSRKMSRGLAPIMSNLGLGNFTRNVGKELQAFNEKIIIDLAQLFYR